MTAIDARVSPLLGLPWLLPRANAPLSLADHFQRYGPLPAVPPDFVSIVAASGLRGRGGAGFPTARKLAAVASERRRSVVVANGSESEPASGKDRTLLALAPHLVLDGTAVAAAAVGATEAIVCVDQVAGGAHRALAAALAERVDQVPVRVAPVPCRYVTGEETALVNWLNGGPAKPTLVPPRPFQQGVHGRPTLIDNVETLAHLALIARYGGAWFRSVGTATAPGSMLVTISGAVARPGVVEAACGTPLSELVAVAGGITEPLSAVLLGGYFGTWQPPETAWGSTLDLNVGAGVIVAFPASVCGLVEVARLARWLAGQSAGQCGPCTNGLPAIAGGVEALAQGQLTADVAANLRRRLTMVVGRGACHLPDGVSRVIASGLNAFSSEIEAHRRGRCTATRQHQVLPLPGS
ncbi:MAG: SLBB domain-containing protein [Actinomycetota bacterium]|nr:SLBB domain-containing protein [Actinomycetota bacterium]